MNFFYKIKGYVINMKMRKKLILIYTISAVIPIITLGIVMTSSMKNMVINRAVTEANTNNDRIKYRFGELFKLMSEVSDRLYTDEKLQKVATTRYTIPWQVVEAYENYKEFDSLLRSYKEIKSIRFYADNDTLLDNSQIIGTTSEIKSKKWYQVAIAKRGRSYWQYVYDELNGGKNLCLTKYIKDLRGNPVGVLVIYVDNQYLQSIIKEEPFETIITLDKDKILISNNKNKNKKINIRYLENSAAENSQTIYNGRRYRLISENFADSQADNAFQVMTMLRVDVITASVNQVGLLGVCIIIFSIILAAVLIVIFSSAFTRRILLLRGEMDRVVSGDLEVKDRGIKRDDEIGILFQDLDYMIISIKQLIHEVYEEKIYKEQIKNKQKEIEFKMLASQINPHFLYNTLETIRMEAHYNGQYKIAEVVKSLGKMLRRNLEVSYKLVTLKSEIELLNNYLYIQKFRMEDRVSYDIQIDFDIDKYYVLPLLLQPIVENAVVHGLENKSHGGKIVLKIERKDKFLRILIRDNGAGMTKMKLYELREKLYSAEHSVEGKSIGLINVHNRIKLYYGERYGLKILSKYMEGTQVYIYLPVKGDEGVKYIGS
ncbi:cache domain-containing sensor histidine kinase [Clostridium oryzae]|uniref:histidine kinase n=1 Tax=Clostridium oryzae TaxID=1450648 RepID=A0A1V4IUE5_9CLOT|nr:sensor histidine kinase [Clostridium oryzae]OPJ63539.1 sensor histidine kinase YpdA [Clostridium oryzae]